MYDAEEGIKSFIRSRLVEMGVEMRACFNCREEIIFMKTVDGKILPVSLNLVLHNSNCPAYNTDRVQPNPNSGNRYQDDRYSRS
jgi:hypothetical protein